MEVLSTSSLALQQLIAIMEAVALGLIYAAVFDLYRSVRMQFRRMHVVLSVIADCSFWLAAAIATVIFLVYRRWGEVYVYTYVGLAGGFMIYFYFFSNFLLPVWLKGASFLFGLRRSRGKEAGAPGDSTGKKSRRLIGSCRIFQFLWRK